METRMPIGQRIARFIEDTIRAQGAASLFA